MTSKDWRRGPLGAGQWHPRLLDITQLTSTPSPHPGCVFQPLKEERSPKINNSGVVLAGSVHEWKERLGRERTVRIAGSLSLALNWLRGEGEVLEEISEFWFLPAGTGKKGCLR